MKMRKDREMTKKYKVTLTKDEEVILRETLDKERFGSQRRKRAEALLLAHEGRNDEEISVQVCMHRRGIEELRVRFTEKGFERTLNGNPRGHRLRILTEKDEAQVLALAKAPTPEGRPRWTLRSMEAAWKTLEGTDTKTISRETIRRILINNKITL
jgi:hypothetical protein